MKRLRYVVIPGPQVEPGKCYLMAAVPTVIPPQPGQPTLIGQRKLNMNMLPVRLEWVDTETNEVFPIEMEAIKQTLVMPAPKGEQ